MHNYNYIYSITYSHNLIDHKSSSGENLSPKTDPSQKSAKLNGLLTKIMIFKSLFKIFGCIRTGELINNEST